MDVYDRLGVRKRINGYATLTRLGGSIMPPPVIAAMAEAAQAFVDIVELQEAVGRRIAELTRNEAAYVCSGAAAGLVLATAACITGTDREKIAQLPHLDGLKNEVIVHRSQRNGYDFAIRQTGIRLVEIGYPRATQPWELEAAITDRTAAIWYFAGAHFARGALPLERVIAIAQQHGVPVLVDAAAQIPPAENLWRFTQMGAAAAVFSGGKGLQGPQSSGLIVGRADLVDAIRLNGNPNQAIGRPMKVGKEEMVGLLAAVEWYLGLDHAALAEQYERQVRNVVDELAGLPGVSARRDWPSEAGQPMPRALVTFAAPIAMSRDEILQQLRSGEPPIEVAPTGSDGLYVNPQTLAEGEERIIARRIREIVGR